MTYYFVCRTGNKSDILINSTFVEETLKGIENKQKQFNVLKRSNIEETESIRNKLYDNTFV
jgi:hypothetical protein